MDRVVQPLDSFALGPLARLLAESPRRASGAVVLRGLGGVLDDSPTEGAAKLIERLAPAPAQHEIRAFRRQGAAVLPLTLASDAGGRVLTASVLRALAQGGTVVLQKIDALDPGWHRLARAFEGLTAQPAQVNLYLTDRATEGLNWHRDPHDVLVWQLAGSKRFALARDLIQGAPRNPEVLLLRAGDLLWMPRGTPHAVSSIVGGSVHASLGLLHLRAQAGAMVRVTDAQGETASPGHPALLVPDLLIPTLAFLVGWRPLRALPGRGQRLRPDLLGWIEGATLHAGGAPIPLSQSARAALLQGRLAASDPRLSCGVLPAADLTSLLALAGLHPLPRWENIHA